jgi:hypothetical protein
MHEVEAALVYGVAGWPVQVHHASRDQWWRVLEVIEPESVPPQPATTDRYILLVSGPLAYLPDRDGEMYIAARRDGDRWLIEPDASAYPRRRRPPGGP